ncbi:MAG: hypothetical protein H3C28_11955 [Sphingomonadales bacterium]|nr:hypothetical protein [Sphingomonadales bacterium]
MSALTRILLIGNLLPLTRLIAVLIFLATSAKADFINTTNADRAPTIAKISISGQQIHLHLEIAPESRSAFAPLIPVSWPDNPDPASNLRQRDVDDFSHRLFCLEVNGKPLRAKLTGAKAAERSTLPSRPGNRYDPLTGTLLPAAPVDKRVYALDFTYDLTEKPQRLVVVPPMSGQAVLANIGFAVDHMGVAINDFDYLGGPEPIELNWQDPWYSRFENPNIARRFKYPFMSFLYIEPFEIRHEILVRLKDLRRFLKVEVTEKSGADMIPLALRFLRANTLVVADGRTIPIESEQINYVEIDRSTMQTLKKDAVIDENTAVLGIIFVYGAKNFPGSVMLDWNIFDERLKEVPAVIIDPAGSYTFALNTTDHTLTWNNARKHMSSADLQGVRSPALRDALMPLLLSMMATAVLSILIWRYLRRRPARLAAMVVVTAMVALAFYIYQPKSNNPEENAESRHLMAALLRNMYRAFDFRGETEVYDKLARTLSETILADVYLAQRQALMIEKAGGATAKVQSVAIRSVMPVSRKISHPSYQVVWDVTGTVGHWGHVHVRTNRYEAMIRLISNDGYWKIDGLDVLSEDRLQ